MMTPRLELPKANDPIFKLVNKNGKNPYTLKPKGDPRRIGNCVWWAGTRFAEITGIWFPSVNAEEFATEAKKLGLEISQTPVEGAIACWEGVGSAAGHVAVVEIINASGSIITSESGWNSKKDFWTQTRVKGNGNWGQNTKYRFLGFILPPKTQATPEEQFNVLRMGDTGANVKKMQNALAVKGYLRKTEVDGDFGKITLGAVLAFQKLNDLELDGVCGPATWSKLKKL
jgi:surface antigen